MFSRVICFYAKFETLDCIVLQNIWDFPSKQWNEPLTKKKNSTNTAGQVWSGQYSSRMIGLTSPHSIDQF